MTDPALSIDRPRASSIARPRPSELARAGRRVLTVVTFGVLPLVVTLAILGTSFAGHRFLYDFHGGLYGAGHAIVRGEDPYQASYLRHQADLKRAGRSVTSVISVPVYPPPVLEAVAPLSFLPYRVAGVLFSLLSIAGLIAGLRLLGVSDWRCYGVAFASWPVSHGLMLGALTPLLLLGVGLAWRYRDHAARAGISVAAVVTAKLFPWPLGVWLLTTRRVRAAVVGAVAASVCTVATWAVIDFAGMTSYPRMLGDLSFLSERAGVSPVAGLLAVGVSATVAHAVALLAGAGLLGAAWSLRDRPDGDRRAICLAILAALIASPMVWPHYFALALVPVALYSPRLSLLWCVPLMGYLAPVAQSVRHPWTIIPYLAISLVLIGTVFGAFGFGERRLSGAARGYPAG